MQWGRFPRWYRSLRSKRVLLIRKSRPTRMPEGISETGKQNHIQNERQSYHRQRKRSFRPKKMPSQKETRRAGGAVRFSDDSASSVPPCRSFGALYGIFAGMSSADARGSGANENICTLVMKTCQMRILTAEKCGKTDTVLV